MTVFYKPIELEHYDNDKILNHPDVQAMRTGREWPLDWNLQLFDLKSVLPEFYAWIERKFHAPITVTRFFVTLPNKNTTIHEDAGYRVSLNIPVINCDNTWNRWWDMVPGSKPKQPGWKRDAGSVDYVANDGGAYMFPKDSALGLKQQVEVTEPMLFLTDIPHNTVTKDLTDPNFPRIILSVRTANMRRTSNFDAGLSVEEFYNYFCKDGGHEIFNQ